MMDEQKLQETYLQYQMIEQQLKQMQEQIQIIDKKIEEAEGLMITLEEMKDTKPGQNVLIPMSNGIFIRGKFISAADLLVNVGSGVVVEKTMPEVNGLIKEQITELQNIRMKAITEFEKILQEYSNLEQQLKTLVK
ncbi:MAG: prefoldin subunit alpha [Nanoarchaeota archaeon]